MLEHCHTAIDAHGGILLTLLVAGLVGSFTHCAGMCGPFVMTQTLSRLDGVDAPRANEFTRLKGAALVPYHLGRMTTYAALGVLAALLAQQVAALLPMRIAGAALLSFAGILFIANAAPGLKRYIPAGTKTSRVADTIGKFGKPLFARPVGWRGYALGAMLGFLPCGLLYGALMVCATTQDPVAAGFGMALFALGTVPGLFAVGLGSAFAAAKWRSGMMKLGRAVMVFNGFALFFMAQRMVA